MIRVALAGLGRIGARYDIGAAPDAAARSHVGAVLANPGFDVVALIDPQPHAARAVIDRWPSLQACGRLTSLDELEPGAADVIVVATPTACRHETVLAAIARRPRLIVVEKPFADDLPAGRKLAAAARAGGVAVRVNFPRRFDPGHRAVRAALPGDPRRIVGRYSKGLRNYAGHAVDLLLDWFGAVEEVQAFATKPDGDDPNITFRCGMAAGFDAVLIGIDALGYDQFELELYFGDRRIELANGGVEKRVACAVSDLHYPGYAQLGAPAALAPPSRVGGMVELYRAIADHLTSGAPLGGCDESAALAGLAVLDAALASLAAGGRALQPHTI